MNIQGIISNKRIVLAFGMIVAIAAVVISGTGAFFSDTETSTANAFTAGSVDVEISEIAHTYQGETLSEEEGADEPNYTDDGTTFELSDLKPLDWGEVSYELSNDTNDAHVCAMVEEAGNAENVRIDPENEAGDSSAGNPGNGNGELQNFMSFDFGSGSGSLNDIEGQWFDVGTLMSGGTTNASIGYCFGEYDGGNCVANTTGDVNVAQTDSMFADISFYAVQTRNNENFNCASLNDGDPVTFVLDDQNSPGTDDNNENETANNAVDGQPWIDWEFVEGGVKFTFHNPTDHLFVFDVQVDGDPGVPREGSNSSGGDLTNVAISEGPLDGENFGNTYQRVEVDGSSTNTVVQTFNGNSEIKVGLREGAEQHWYIDWITFVAQN